MDDFLPVKRKAILPGSMPVGFRFPPGIAFFSPFVSPMPNHVLAALGDRLSSATLAYAPLPRPGFGSLTVDKRVSHQASPSDFDQMVGGEHPARMRCAVAM